MAPMSERKIAELNNRIRSIVGRGVLHAVDNAQATQRAQVQVLAGEVLKDVEVFGHYGLVSVPPADSEGVAVFVGGNRDHPIVIATNEPGSRDLSALEGEVGLQDDQGKLILLKRDGTVHISGATTVIIDGDLQVTGNITAAGDVNDAKGSMENIRGQYNQHTHGENGTGGGTTDPPFPQFP